MGGHAGGGGSGSSSSSSSSSMPATTSEEPSKSEKSEIEKSEIDKIDISGLGPENYAKPVRDITGADKSNCDYSWIVEKLINLANQEPQNTKRILFRQIRCYHCVQGHPSGGYKCDVIVKLPKMQ